MWLWPMHTDQHVRNDHCSPESKITESQLGNNVCDQPLKLIPSTWHLLPKVLEVFLHAGNLHL